MNVKGNSIQLLIILLFIGFYGCKEKIDDTKVGTCSPLPAITTKNHPKQELYSNLLKNYVKKGLPGISMVVDKKGEDLWIGTAGVTKIEGQIPLEPCNLFFSGGIGKLFTASATMQLAEDDLIHINDKLNKLLPAEIANRIPNGQELTVGHLLSHSSGISDFEDNNNFLLDLMNDYSMKLNREIILDRYVYDSKPLFAVGTKQQYSSSNYEILALLLDHVTGKNHAQLFTNKIFKQLKLKHIYYRNEAGYPLMENRGLVNGYIDRMSVDKLENITDVMAKYANDLSGSRGVIGTPYDYYLFLKGLMDNNFLNEASIEKMKTYPEKNYDLEEQLFGLGFMYKKTRYGMAIGHSGSTFGSAIELWYFVDKKTYVCQATNVSNFFDGPAQNLFDHKLWEEALQEIF